MLGNKTFNFTKPLSLVLNLFILTRSTFMDLFSHAPLNKLFISRLTLHNTIENICVTIFV